MSKYVIDSSTLTAIGDAVRGKDGSTDPILVSEIASKIEAIPAGGGGVEIPDEAFVLSGDCDYRFANNGWNWFIENYGNQITAKMIFDCENMFRQSSLETIPFDLSGYVGYEEEHGVVNSSLNYLFYLCKNLKTVGDIKNFYIKSLGYIFNQCNNLRNLPNFINCNFDALHDNTGSNSNLFNGCWSLRSIPETLLKELYTKATSKYSSIYSSMFQTCYALDEIRGINSRADVTWTADFFSGTFNNCYRVKDIIFATDNGTPYVRSWKAQVIDLSTYVGYGYGYECPNITSYNSGITADKQVTDADTYASLKNDPDWFTANIAYSRYNHDSAVNTLNSLPDTMEYVTAQSGTNTIKFLGSAGSATDGGAINTLTEEEIAVATAKGWTVTLV